MKEEDGSSVSRGRKLLQHNKLPLLDLNQEESSHRVSQDSRRIYRNIHLLWRTLSKEYMD